MTDGHGRLIPDFSMANTSHYYIGDPPPMPAYPPGHFVVPQQPARSPVPSIAEQMGTDPMSKLAAAVHDLADALRSNSCNNCNSSPHPTKGDGGSGI